jgi:hypothetical protein
VGDVHDGRKDGHGQEPLEVKRFEQIGSIARIVDVRQVGPELRQRSAAFEAEQRKRVRHRRFEDDQVAIVRDQDAGLLGVHDAVFAAKCPVLRGDVEAVEQADGDVRTRRVGRRERIAARLSSLGRRRPTAVGEAIDDGSERRVDRVVAMRAGAESRTRILHVPPLSKELLRGQPAHVALGHQLVHHALQGKALEDHLFGDHERAPDVDARRRLGARRSAFRFLVSAAAREQAR